MTNALLATNLRFIGYSELGTLAPVQAIQIGSFLVRMTQQKMNVPDIFIDAFQSPSRDPFVIR